MLPDFVNTEQGRSIKQKAREISYALIRVSFYVKRADFRSRLEMLAIELLENSAKASANASSENINQALASISVLDGLVRLAHSIYEIEPVNATILIRELDSLNSAMRQFGSDPSRNLDHDRNNSAMRQSLNIEEFFSKTDKLVPVQQEDDKKPKGNPSTEFGGNGNGNNINSVIRQSAIINKIRSGNGNPCRLKDLIAEFPDVSERTLRYDLRGLCEQGVIERIGNGGPASYYRERNDNKAISL